MTVPMPAEHAKSGTITEADGVGYAFFVDNTSR